MVGVIKTAIICITIIACLWIVLQVNNNNNDEKGGE